MKPSNPAPLTLGAYQVTPRVATMLDGLRKDGLIYAALQTPHPDPAVQTAALALYPATQAADWQMNGQPAPPPELSAFLALPEADVARFLQAVWELNPHWSPGQEAAAPEKKARKPTRSMPG